MKKKLFIKKRYIALVCLIIVFILISRLLQGVVYPVIVGYAKAKMDNMIIAAINNAIFNVLKDPVTYSDLITVHRDTDGNIAMLEADAYKISTIANKTARATDMELEKIEDQTIEFNIGSLLNSPLLTGLGPKIKIRIISDGIVYCRFRSEFESAGINQTRHKIFIEVCASMEVILPLTNEKVDCLVEIYIAEAVLVGKIPDVYLNVGGGNFFDFVP